MGREEEEQGVEESWEKRRKSGGRGVMGKEEE